MKTPSYKGCHECLALACCSQVCVPYKRAIQKKYDLTIDIIKVSLTIAEDAVFLYLEIKKSNKLIISAILKEVTNEEYVYIQTAHIPKGATNIYMPTQSRRVYGNRQNRSYSQIICNRSGY